MYKLIQAIKKETRLLIKDVGGLVILFIMPIFLLITVTWIQNNNFNKYAESKIEILLVDSDKGMIAQKLTENLQKSKNFLLVNSFDGKPLTEQKAKELVFIGKYKLAIVIPANLSTALQQKVDQNVHEVLREFGVGDSIQPENTVKITIQKVNLYFDPAVQETFKTAVKSAFEKNIAAIENTIIYTSFEEKLGTQEAGGKKAFQEEKFVQFNEILPNNTSEKLVPNAVQHNVPAWALFAIFFIIVPLSINIVKEKNQGTFIRLKTMPTPYIITIWGKTITYLLICIAQFWVMIAISKFVFPYIGLASLTIGTNIFLATIVAIAAGLAAIGIGILLGTIAKTQEQSAPFGATFVIILAAIGGIWIPAFAMPKVMQYIALISPMNWGLDAFYDVLLRGGGLGMILPKLALLIAIYLILVFSATLYEKRNFK